MRAHPLALAIVLSSAPCLGADSLPGAPAIRVPFVVGLSTVRAVSTPEGDYEVLRVVDAIDNDAANLDLSKRRAAAVKAALVSRYAVDASRLTTGGYGEGSPRATNETPEGRALNRRVELRRE